MTGVARNLLLSIGIIALAVKVAAWIAWTLQPSVVVETLGSMWVVYALLAGLVTPLLFKLNELPSIEGATLLERSQLDTAVKRKTLRLWALLFLFVACAFVSRLPTYVSVGFTEQWRAFVSIALSIIALLYWCYVPFMWIEVRKYRVALERSIEDQKRLDAYLKTMRESAEEKKDAA